MAFAQIYNFKYPNKKNSFKDIIFYYPILKGIIVLEYIVIIILIVLILNQEFLIYVLSLISPVITVTLIHIINSYASFKYEKNLKNALIDEIIYNIHSLESNKNVLLQEESTLKQNKISTDPLLSMIWEIWDIIKIHYASKQPEFDIATIYQYIRSLVVLNGALDERRLYTLKDFSARIEYNKLIDSLSLEILEECQNALKTLNTEIFTFSEPTINEVEEKLNREKIPFPADILPLFSKPIVKLIIIVNLN
jgi:hypothetical protein